MASRASGRPSRGSPLPVLLTGPRGPVFFRRLRGDLRSWPAPPGFHHPQVARGCARSYSSHRRLAVGPSLPDEARRSHPGFRSTSDAATLVGRREHPCPGRGWGGYSSAGTEYPPHPRRAAPRRAGRTGDGPGPIGPSPPLLAVRKVTDSCARLVAARPGEAYPRRTRVAGATHFRFSKGALRLWHARPHRSSPAGLRPQRRGSPQR